MRSDKTVLRVKPKAIENGLGSTCSTVFCRNKNHNCHKL